MIDLAGRGLQGKAGWLDFGEKSATRTRERGKYGRCLTAPWLVGEAPSSVSRKDETPVTMTPQQEISKTLHSSKILLKYLTFTFGEIALAFGGDNVAIPSASHRGAKVGNP